MINFLGQFSKLGYKVIVWSWVKFHQIHEKQFSIFDDIFMLVQIKEAGKVRLISQKIIECIFLERTIVFIFKKNKFDQFFLGEGPGGAHFVKKIVSLLK